MVLCCGLWHTFLVWPRGLALVQFLYFRHRSLRSGQCRKKRSLCGLPVGDSKQNPYSPPCTPTSGDPLTRDDTPAPIARPGFRIVAAALAFVVVYAGWTSLFPLAIRTSLVGGFMIIFGLQFAYAAVTGQWCSFGQRRP